jgi:hypothetical protein
VLACGLTIAVMATGASGASASVFYVNGGTGKDTNACTSAGAPCETIGAAVVKSEAVLGAATIEVAAGVYPAILKLSNPADNGITINGAGSGGGGTVIEGSAVKEPTVSLKAPGNTAVLSNLRVVDPAGQEGAGVNSAADLTLNNVVIDMQNAGAYNGIETGEVGALAINGGGVTMETGNAGKAIIAGFNPLTVNGTTVTLADGATGGGIMVEGSPLSLTNVTVNLGNAAKGGIQSTLAPVSLSNVAVNVNSPTSFGLEIALPNPLSASGVKVAMENAASTAPGVAEIYGTGTFSHLEVAGAWKGPAFEAQGSAVTLSDSRLIDGAASTTPAAIFLAAGEGRGPLIQRSVLQAPATAGPGTLLVQDSNATVDSSEILGGHSGVTFEHSAGKARTLTIAGSTIDAGVLGERDGAGVFDVSDRAAGTASIANVSIEGSILLEPQQATIAAGENSANVTCAYSDVPNQAQVATATEGAINCANGASGNATTNPLASLFSAPITNYNPLPGSPAIDSVPAGAISLPFGIAPSATDLAGNPRVVDGNGDCVAVQDKGALELQGHSVACPPAPEIPCAMSSGGCELLVRMHAPVLADLTISPSSFLAAPSGATISKTGKKAKKAYGASIGYTNSRVATTTFTVLRLSSGRTQGKSCKKPSKADKHGKRCTIYTALGSFTHTDTAGANKLHFSGRLKGKKLAKGSYKLQAVPHNAAGNGVAVSKEFKIKG